MPISLNEVVELCLFVGDFPSPIATLERLFSEGGTTLVRAVFENTFFVSPDAVRARTPYFPGHARKSREHYPKLDKGASALWGHQPVKLDDNSRAQMAWKQYTGRLARGSGYGVRHIWGNPWDPTGFTAGWNLAYMPFWAGMLTEDQHPHPLVQSAIKQAAWDLFFRGDPVCDAPGFVDNPGIDLDELLDGQPLLIAVPPPATAVSVIVGQLADGVDQIAVVKEIRSRRNASWSNLRKAARKLQGLDHEPFGTKNVENGSLGHVRSMMRETGLGLDALAAIFDGQAS